MNLEDQNKMENDFEEVKGFFNEVKTGWEKKRSCEFSTNSRKNLFGKYNPFENVSDVWELSVKALGGAHNFLEAPDTQVFLDAFLFSMIDTLTSQK